MKYRTIVADPPWPYSPGPKKLGFAPSHYKVMSIDDICSLKIKDLTDKNAHLYLWVTNFFLKEGFKVLESWGFRYVTTLTWFKGKNIGMPGRYFVSDTEHILFGIKGSQKTSFLNVSNVITETNKMLKHSEKPDVFYKLVEYQSPGPYLELFARRKRPDWHSWGNEIDSDIKL